MAEAVSMYFNVKLERSKELEANDYLMLTQAGKPFSVLEVKVRYGYSWTELNFKGSYLLSAKKWLTNVKIAHTNGWAFCLAVGDKHGEVWAATWRPPWPTFNAYEGGRTDRNDKMDQETCVFIPTSEFTHMVRDRREQ